MKYKIKEVTPQDMMCAACACESIYSSKNREYYIVGKVVGLEEIKSLGIEGKVGKGECMIKVDKKLIDEKEN